MSGSTRLRLGKLWKEKPESRPMQVNDDHPYIAEYENSIKTEVKEEPKPKKKGKRY